MSDPKVHDTQQWLNQTYGDHPQWNPLDVDGAIGWQTVFGMIRALQIELGIATLSDNFGDGTMAALTTQYPVINPLTPDYNIRRLVQSALWCHGFQGGFEWGTFDAVTNNGVKSFMYNSGLVGLNDTVPTEITPKMLKALMTLDAYTLLAGGTPQIREAQQWINRTYLPRKQSLLPCDGIFTRSTQQGLMTVIQYELNMTDAQANGNFGPGTKSGLQANGNLAPGAVDGVKHWVHLFQCALRMNGYDAPLNGSFDSATVSATADFQTYAELPGGGSANFQTWASLLISTGDETRPGIASDMATPLSPTYCSNLYSAGYRTVGRYLTVSSKRYHPGELGEILDAGLKTFPIMQEANTSIDYFDREIGLDHGRQALQRLRQLGFKGGGAVFFAVDFDAMDHEIDSNVIPYFEGVKQRMDDALTPYKIGVYGTRNVCRRIVEAGLAEESFIASMSWGWGGNLGYALPPSWSYDQIWNGVLPGSSLEIDKDVQSSRARPYGPTDVLRTPIHVVPVIPGGSATMAIFDERYYWYICEVTVLSDQQVLSKSRSARLALTWLARLNYNSLLWDAYIPNQFELEPAWSGLSAEMANRDGGAAPSETIDRARISHWAAATRGYLHHWDNTPPSGNTATWSDLGGWPLDLAQSWEDYLNSETTQGIRTWIGENLGTPYSLQFDEGDLMADVDGYLVASMLRADPGRDLHDCVRAIEVSCEDDPTWRYRRFVDQRFGGSFANLAIAGQSVFDEFWTNLASGGFIAVRKPDPDESVELGLGFMDAMKRMAGL